MRTIVCAVLISVVMLTTAVLADVPGLMNYQGTLTDDNGMALDTTVAMTFSIYTDSTGGSQVWTETQPAVGVNSGIFNVLLGRVNAISDTVFKDPSRWLGVQVGGDSELVPRQRMAAVGYALQSATGGSDGDWTIDGDDLYRLSGNVGIGTPSPTQKLQVGGTDTRLLVQGGGDNTGMAIYFTGSGGRRYDILSTGAYDPIAAGKLKIRDVTGGMDVFIIESGKVGIRKRPVNELSVDGDADFTGNVGIGTTSPSYPLDVAGVVNAATYYGDGSNLTGIAAQADSDWTISGNDMYSAVSGNVGIGTPSPTQKLQVGGTDTRLLIQGGGDNTGMAIYFTGSGGRRYDILSTGAYDPIAAGKLKIRDVTGGMDVFIIESGKVGIRKRPVNELSVDGDADFTGNVGIGTTSPSYPLDVAGVVNAATYYGDGSNLTGIAAQADSDWTISGNDMYSAVSGNVGIGTPSPTQKLQVGGTDTRLLIQGGGDNTGMAIYFTGSGGRRYDILSTGAYDPIAAGKLKIRDVTGGMDVFIIESGKVGIRKRPANELSVDGDADFTGNVGIGTTSPTDELHVVGDIYCTGKLTSDGGNDPPYVLYNKESRAAIVERVASEVPEAKQDGAVLFWNGQDKCFEVYLPEDGEFRDLDGNLLSTVEKI